MELQQQLKKKQMKKKDVAATNLQFMINGLSSKQKLDVHFDYGKKKMNKY